MDKSTLTNFRNAELLCQFHVAAIVEAKAPERTLETGWRIRPVSRGGP